MIDAEERKQLRARAAGVRGSVPGEIVVRLLDELEEAERSGRATFVPDQAVRTAEQAGENEAVALIRRVTGTPREGGVLVLVCSKLAAVVLLNALTYGWKGKLPKPDGTLRLATIEDKTAWHGLWHQAVMAMATPDGGTESPALPFSAPPMKD